MSFSRIYVGNLPSDVRERELDDLFYKYGRIEHIALKAGPRGAYAFIDFRDPRDARDAAHGRDGIKFGGEIIRVEPARGRASAPGAGGAGGGARGPPRRSEFRVEVEGLPPTASWQDLKDHMRECGDIGFTDVRRDGTAVAEFTNADDMERAVRKLDGSVFRNKFEEGTIRVRAASGGSRRRERSPPRGRSRSGSRGRSRSRSGSRGRSRSRSGSRGRSRSGSRGRSRSRSRSRGRSESRGRDDEKRGDEGDKAAPEGDQQPAGDGDKPAGDGDKPTGDGDKPADSGMAEEAEQADGDKRED